MWKLKTRAWVCGVAAVALSGCAGAGPGGLPTAQPTIYPPAVFAHRVSTSDIDVYWNCTQPEADVIRLDGVVKNSGGQEVQFVELDLAAADARDRYISEAKTSLADIVLHMNQISPFVLEIRTFGAAVRLDLYYKYRFPPRAGRPGSLRSEVRELARDVCSPTQHLVPKSAY